jgi:hypothetical protein
MENDFDRKSDSAHKEKRNSIRKRKDRQIVL